MIPVRAPSLASLARLAALSVAIVPALALAMALAGCDPAKQEQPKTAPKELTFSMTGARIVPQPPRSAGSVDDVHLQGDKITISGWAINPEKDVPADGVVVLNQDYAVLGLAPINGDRPDVGKALDRKDLSASGYTLVIPADVLVGADTRFITICAYSLHDRTLFPIRPDWLVEIVNARVTLLKRKAPPTTLRVGG